MMLKDKEHQEELDRAMRALAIKDKQLAAKDALTKKVKKAYKTSLHAICKTCMTPPPTTSNKINGQPCI